MKNTYTTLIITAICFTLMAFQCEDDNELTQEEERIELNTLKSEIENLANTSVCNDTSACKFIALGSKLCGGPWGYLVYSTSVDADKLERLVETYNQKETDFNTKWGIASDCAIANPPTNVICENNTCVAVY